MSTPAGEERILAHLAFARAVAARSLGPRCRGADREDLIPWAVEALDRHRDPNEERNGGIMVTHLRFGATFVLELVS